MTVKRYVAAKDTTITNAYKEDLATRATDANMGLSDSLEVFSIFAQANATSSEASRILVEFPVSTISTDRTSGLVAASGSAQFILKLSNAPHPMTTPRNFTLVVEPVSRSWDEGHGLDMEQYKDLDVANWLTASTGVVWTTSGGDYHISPAFSASFPVGNEDLEVDITSLVEQWLAGTKQNYGVGIRLVADQEIASSSYYTKKFFSRGSEYFFRRPWIEARSDNSILDDRNNFYVSSSLAPAADNLNNLYLYNRIRGRLRDIPSVGTGSIYVSLYSGSSGPTGSALTLGDGNTVATGSWVSTGIYNVSLALDTTSSAVWDVWHNNQSGAGRIEYMTGSQIDVFDIDTPDNYQISDYVLNITNLKRSYGTHETARFNLYVRDRDWQPTSYTKAVNQMENLTINEAFYRVYRVADDYNAIPYGTGSYNHTKLSYDKDGNWFDLDMSLLEPGFMYGLQFVFYDSGEYYEQPQVFKFRVDKK